MTRGNFLRNLIGFYGIASLPLEMVKQYQKVYLLQCFVRGFQYYEGPKIVNQINSSGLLEMVHEPDNEYDPCAIALHFNNQKIGFIPMESNEVLSVLLDTKLLDLQAEITHIEPNASDWESIYVAIYAMTEIKDNQTQENIEPYTLLETPKYYTLKSNHNTYTRIYLDDENEILNGEQFYETLVNNSSTDIVYDLIHYSFDNGQEMETVINESRMVIQKNSIPKDIEVSDLEATLNDKILKIENVFDDDGYIIANVNKVATIPDRIQIFEKLMNKHGKLFYEIIFKN
ncbi:HIRAN domain-containing protein [Flavobacterium sp. 1]|uniref:HIRAN domain-containing protein n=1 Tax=Flavobacterium sp. 1 TaxID=2035200 RepID=UPI000C2457CD|nr:HIRAN domain-containing protein [Flavobacterium sp. 1]PJJ07226.1 HIRAN domain-containing protein [Flavobacterium sp. 1]